MTTSKRISPGAYDALQEALASIHWYKPRLRGFLNTAMKDCPEVLQNLDWDNNYKIVVVGTILDRMKNDENRYRETVLQLMQQVVDFPSFSHLASLDGGADKVERAQTTVAALREWFTPHAEQVAEMNAAEERRQRQRETDLGNQAFQASLEKIKLSLYELHAPGTDPNKRGLILETLLRDLFELFDLDPRRSFKLQGEQIDGAFTYDGTDYIVEARWVKKPIEPKAVRDFQGKVSAKLDNTLGLFVSMNGFTENAVTLHLGTRPNVIALSGADLYAVLEGRIDLIHLLLRKRRHAAQTGEIYLPIEQILTEC